MLKKCKISYRLGPDSLCPWKSLGWTLIDGKEYYLAPVEETNWFQADAKALEQGAFLLEIDSPAENSILEKIKHCEFTIIF